MKEIELSTRDDSFKQHDKNKKTEKEKEFIDNSRLLKSLDSTESFKKQEEKIGSDIFDEDDSNSPLIPKIIFCILFKYYIKGK